MKQLQCFVQKHFRSLVISIFLLLIILLSFSDVPKNTKTEQEINQNTILSEAETAGRLLSANKCSGKGPVILTNSPMNPDDFSILIPYGLVIGAHVTPIDHQYFSPIDYNSKRDSYGVYAVADGTIVDIQSRDRTNHNDSTDTFKEYRIVFMHTCTFLRISIW